MWQQGWSFRAVCSLLAAALLGSLGCHGLVNRVRPPCSEELQCCQGVPACARDHVHIFIINGIDPLSCANLQGVREHLHELGYRKTYYAHFFHRGWVEQEVRKALEADPCARVVVLGFSFGANTARDVVQTLRAEGRYVDLLVYMGGNTLEEGPRDNPDNVGRLVNVLAKGCVWNGADFSGAENLHLEDVFHFGSPAHPRTLEVLARELAVVAGRVPVAEFPPGEPLALQGSVAPAGPVGIGPAETVRGEWDFLRPAGRLQAVEDVK